MRHSIIILLFLALVSCSEKNPDIVKDNILYKNLDPSVKISSVQTYTLEDHGVCQVDVPVPEDSVITIGLDIDNDNYNDFLFDISHNRWESNQYCGHCSVFEYQITISGVNDNNKISFNSSYSWEPKWYSLNDTILPASSWNNPVFLSMQGGCDRWILDLKDTYIGIKHNNNIGWIHVAPLENNGLEIKAYAINLTVDRPIIAGQMN